MKRITIVWAILSALLIGQTQAAEFKLEAGGQEPLYQTILNKSVYQSSASHNLGDLTVQNASGEQVPYALVEDNLLHADNVKKTRQALRLFPLSEKAIANTQQLQLALATSGDSTQLNIQNNAVVSQDKTVYLVDAGKDHPALQTLVVDWQGEEGQFINVTALASDDLEHWSTIGQGVLLKTTSEGQTILQNVIRMDYPSKSRYFQLVPQLQTSATLKLLKVEAQYEQTSQVTSQALWQELTWLKREDDGHGQVNIDYEALGYYPATAIKIGLPEQNTITNVHIFVRNNLNDPWMLLSAASLYRTVKQGKPVVNPDIVIQPHEARFWRLQFHQTSGGIGQQNPVLQLGWVPNTVVWNARGQGPHTMQLGQQPSMTNRLALADLMPQYTQEKLKQLPKATLTAVDGAPTDAVQSSWVSPPDYKRWLLWAGLFVGVLVLAGMAWSLLKSSKQTS